MFHYLWCGLLFAGKACLFLGFLAGIIVSYRVLFEWVDKRWGLKGALAVLFLLLLSLLTVAGALICYDEAHQTKNHVTLGS